MGRRGGDFKTYFETYIRYSRVADEEQKKGLRGYCLFKLSEEGDLIKDFWKPWSKVFLSSVYVRGPWIY